MFSMSQESARHSTYAAGPSGWLLPPGTVPSAGSVLPTEFSPRAPRKRGLAGWWVVLVAVVVAMLVVLAITAYRSHQAAPIISAANAAHGAGPGDAWVEVVAVWVHQPLT